MGLAGLTVFGKGFAHGLSRLFGGLRAVALGIGGLARSVPLVMGSGFRAETGKKVHFLRAIGAGDGILRADL